MKLFSIIILGALFGIVGCNKEVKSENSDLSYQYSENGCDTGKVKYADASDLCAALKDDSRNKNCASSMRYGEFKRSCPGQQW